MYRVNNRIITLLVLLVVAAASWWLSDVLFQKEKTLHVTSERRPDYVIENFSSSVMDKQGEKKYVLEAEQLRHYPGDEVSELDKPYLIQFSATAPPVHTHADHGLLYHQNKRILMTGNVEITRKEQGSSAKSVVTANRLDIFLE